MLEDSHLRFLHGVANLRVQLKLAVVCQVYLSVDAAALIFT